MERGEEGGEGGGKDKDEWGRKGGTRIGEGVRRRDLDKEWGEGRGLQMGNGQVFVDFLILP